MYVDISKHFSKKQDAVQFGIKNNQKAIYNIEKNQSEYITKKVYILYKYNVLKNDINYIMEYKTIDEIASVLKTTKNALQHKINYNIDNKIELLKNNYCIFCESVEL